MREYCHDSKSAKVVYGSPKEITMYVPREAIMFILEMNNDENRIMGVGLVKNIPYPNKHIIYEEGNWNRHNFVGKHRIDRNELKEDEEVFAKVMESISRKTVLKEIWKIKIVNEKQAVSKLDKAKTKIDIAEELLNEED